MKRKQWNANKNLHTILAMLIFALAALLRLIYLGEVPSGMNQDEIFPAWTALSLLENQIDSAGSYWPVYIADWGDGHSALYSWLMIPLLWLNGTEWTPFISRLPQAIMGILTVVAVYFIFKKLFDSTYALWAAFIIAICPWHIMLCRWGLDANLAPAFLVFGFYFFILGLENNKYFILAAITYGLSLHCYAVIWPVVPIIIFLQIAYGVYHQKISLCWTNIISVIILGLIALPLLLFLFINTFQLEAIKLPFLTIPTMPGYRGGEVAFSFAELWANFKRFARLFVYQDTGSPYDVLMPSGLFYNIGRVFIVIGVISLLINMIRKLIKKEYAPEFLLFVQLLCGGINAILVEVRLHQANAALIALVLFEAYGVVSVLNLLKQYKKLLAFWSSAALVGIFLFNLVVFQKVYYTDYKEIANAYFGYGIEECVTFAAEQATTLKATTDEPTIIFARGMQWPRALLFTDTSAPEYLSTVIYKENKVEPLTFIKDGITWCNGIYYDNIQTNAIYIIYFTDIPIFEKDFNLTQFYDWWYVATPKP